MLRKTTLIIYGIGLLFNLGFGKIITKPSQIATKRQALAVTPDG
jgi:hypothetical protein